MDKAAPDSKTELLLNQLTLNGQNRTHFIGILILSLVEQGQPMSSRGSVLVSPNEGNEGRSTIL